MWKFCIIMYAQYLLKPNWTVIPKLTSHFYPRIHLLTSLHTSLHKGHACTDLPQGALQASKEVIIIQSAGGVVDVVDHELEFLHLLEAIVDLYDLAELRIQRVLDPFRPSQLQPKF